MRVFIRLAVVCLPKCELAQNSQIIRTYSSSTSRSSKVDDFGTNQKRICDFLLVINGNFGCILHVTEIRRLIGWKLRTFHTPVLFGGALPLSPLEFRGEVKHLETRVKGLLCGEGCMILTSTVFAWSTRVTDRQTDGRTDRRTHAINRDNKTYYRPRAL